MNPPSERRFPLIPSAKADTGVSPGAVAFLEDIIDACVMESYFREQMAERDLLFHDTVAPQLAAYAPEASAAQQRDWVTHLHQTFNAPSNPISTINPSHPINTIPAIATVKASSTSKAVWRM